MRVLLIKTSSMGDIIHALPALTDAGSAIPGITFDWVVEDSFAEIPRWHPLVNKIIPVSLRKWRKGIFSQTTRAGLKQFKQTLRGEKYDLVLDAQGLIKSAFLTCFASGLRCGLDFKSARESLASFAYQKKFTVNLHQHAVVRMRRLFSLALGYPLPVTPPDFGLTLSSEHKINQDENYLVFLFGTTWASKQWPESYWIQLADLARQAGLRVKVSGNDAEEMAVAERIGANNPAVDVLPRMGISAMATLLANAKGVVAVDTGFGHLAAAFDVPTVSIYGSTNPEYTGALGGQSTQLATNFPCSPCLARECQFTGASEVKPACYATVSPVRVWAALGSSLVK